LWLELGGVGWLIEMTEGIMHQKKKKSFRKQY
jgi:hypothetical protein